MNARVPRLLFALTFVMGLGFAAAARVTAQAPAATSVQIETLAIEGTVVTISGRNFGNGAPTVSINDTNLAVSRNSDTEIVAVTQQLEPGMYVLKVIRDASEGGTGTSTLQIR
jgi:hypothetical protein